MENSVEIPKKLKINVRMTPDFTSGHSSEETENSNLKDRCTLISAALFTVDKI